MLESASRLRELVRQELAQEGAEGGRIFVGDANQV
jgi:hypothetical protein